MIDHHQGRGSIVRRPANARLQLEQPPLRIGDRNQMQLAPPFALRRGAAGNAAGQNPDADPASHARPQK